MQNRRHTLDLTTLLFLIVLLTPSLLAAETGGWTLRFGAVAAEPDGEFEDASNDFLLRTSADTAYGGAFSAEYHFSQRVGVEIGTMAFADDDVSVRVGEPGTNDDTLFLDRLGFQPTFVGLTFHLTPKSRANLYISPFVSYVRYRDFSLVIDTGTDELSDLVPDSFSIDNDWAFGAAAGIDVPIGSGGWLFNTSVRYLKSSLDTGTASVDYDPLIATVGFGLRLGN